MSEAEGRKDLDLGRALAPRRRVSCGDVPGEHGCTLTISGTEEEVLRVAVWHACDAHGRRDSPELREAIRAMMKEARD